MAMVLVRESKVEMEMGSLDDGWKSWGMDMESWASFGSFSSNWEEKNGAIRVSLSLSLTLCNGHQQL
ncbi:hypothetical protein RIF29_29465 [Crotalaria pallida]|uniref:Uncharacterized protein n=1 Tax=Crotalaria pallida TaxID=3830 RepID=A0AAN9EF21_CROPI